MTESKKCNNCNLSKDIINFSKDRSTKDGYHNYCKLCRNSKRNEFNKNKVFVERKICSGCNLEKDVELFCKDRKTKDGYFTKCKECLKEKLEKRAEINSKIDIYKLKEYKVCNKCKINKLYNEFYRNDASIDGLYHVCIKCEKKRCGKPEKRIKVKNRVLISRYNLSLEEFNKLKESQNNLCLICHMNRKLVIDHCHTTEKFRGLLCTQCNSGLGMFKDSTENLESAIIYLRNSK